MAFLLADRVGETSTTIGTGTLTLLGASPGCNTFLIGIGSGNTCYYSIVNPRTSEWEEGIGTVVSGTLERTTVTNSSNADTLVNFKAGTKNVVVSLPAGKLVYKNAAGNVSLPNQTTLSSTDSMLPSSLPSLNLDFVNSGQLDPRITFARNSTATYYDGQTSALAEQNLFVYSQEYQNIAGRWPTVNTTSTINASTAPDGTSTANNIVPTTLSAAHHISQAVTTLASLTYTVSFFAKPNGYNYITIELSGSSTYAIYDVSAGTVGIKVGSPTTSITSVGNGWYRCTLTKTISTATTAVRAYVDSFAAGTVYAGDGTSGIYIWGAQFEQRSSATAYTKTTTAAITNYIPQLMTAPAGVARFDCDPITGKSLGLLIEESRTNLLNYSSDFSNAVWHVLQSSIVSSATVAPDGTQTAQKIIGNTSVNLHGTNLAFTPAIGTYTKSIYAKAAGYNWLLIQIACGGINVSYSFNLSSGSIGTAYNITGTSTATITSVGNGWYRCTLTGTTTSVVAGQIRYWVQASDTNGYIAGNGYSGIYIWGAQLEAGSFATSYIPTTTTALSRAADSASMTGTNFSSWYNQSEGSFCINADRSAIQDSSGAGGYGRILGNNGNTNSFLEYSPNTTVLNMSASSSVSFTIPVLNTTANVLNTIAMTYSSSGVSASANGSTAQTNTTRMNSADRLVIFGSGANAYNTSGHIRKLSYYPRALSSSELQGLTK